MLKHILFLLLIAFPTALMSSNFNDRYKFEVVSPESGFVFTAVTTISSDKNNFIWFGCENGLYCYNGQTFQKYYNHKNDESSIPSNIVNSLLKDSKERMWICTRKGLSLFDERNNNFKRIKFPLSIPLDITQLVEKSDNQFLCLCDGKIYIYDHQMNKFKYISIKGKAVSVICKKNNNKYLLGTTQGEVYELFLNNNINLHRLFYKVNDEISTICCDRDWIYVGYKFSGIDIIYDNGIYKKSLNSSSCGSDYLPSNKVRKIICNKNGEIWIGTFKGIVVINNNNIDIITSDSFNIPSNSIFDIYQEHDNVWIGSWSGGLSFYNSNGYHFKKQATMMNRIDGIGTVSSFAVKDENSIWVGTERNGLLLFNYKDDKIIREIPINGYSIKSLIKIGDLLWIGTVEDGLLYYDEKKNKTNRIDLKYPRKLVISQLIFNDGNLWMATRGEGIIKYNISSGNTRFYNIDNKGITCNRVWQLYIDNHGDVYACCDDGLYIKPNSDDTFKEITKDMDLSFYSLFSNSNYDFYIGSKNEGLFTYNNKTKTLKRKNINSQLDKCDIYTLHRDDRQRLWMSTNDGIYSLDQQSNILKHYTSYDGLLGNQFHPIANILLPNGYMFWGGNNGFNYIDTKKISINNLKVKVFPISILVNEKNIIDDKEIIVNSNNIPNINSIELKYNQNNISFSLSTNNMLKPQENRLRYRLLGLQKNWIEISQLDQIKFSQLPYGKYVLEVVGSNNDNIWSDSCLKINIIIKPPFYKTSLAYLLYLLSLLSITIVLYKFIKGRIILKRKVEIQEYKNNLDKNALNERTKFFMNISHELCTPLNLINAPLSILEKEDLNKENNFHISTIRRNTNRLLKLTEQILDLRLLEVNKIKVNKDEFDFNSLCKGIINNFDYYINEKNVNLTYKSDNEHFRVIADQSMLEKVVYNLLMNSLNFTPNGGNIDIEVTKTELSDEDYAGTFYVGERFFGKAFQFTIKDNGCGIPCDKFGIIFERFQTLNQENHEGSGIGLHICKEFITLHNGNMMVESQVSKGSCFTFNLPLIKDLDIQHEKSPIIINIIPKSEEQNIPKTVDDNVAKKKYSVLIIENNDETIFYIKHALKKYKCIIAKNEEYGVTLSQQCNPDIIIFDSPLSLENVCTYIKQLKSLNHSRVIPLIVFSSMSDQKTQYDCISSGADLFLTKPIDELLLNKHVEYLLGKQSQQMESNVPELPKEFMKRVDYIIEENLQNWDFDVNVLADKMNISRSSLFRRIKKENNCNITEYIKERRLMRSITLMKNNASNIEEIATACGFNSASYFSKCFKMNYGKSPKEYIRDLN